MGPPAVLLISTPPVYSYLLRDALCGTEEEKRMVRLIGFGQHVVRCIIVFIDACRSAFLFSRFDDSGVYNCVGRRAASLESGRENHVPSEGAGRGDVHVTLS